MGNWRIIITFTYPHEAHMAKTFLESEGVNTIIRDELTAQVNNFYSIAIGGVKLLVSEGDYKRGIEILTKGGYLNPVETRKKIEFVIEDAIMDKRFCPFCKSRNIGIRKKTDTFTAFIYAILALFSPAFKRTYVCLDCKKEWKYSKKK
jgi:hypothetical protein